LGVETIDLYQVHRFDPHTPLDEMLSALDLLVRQGKVRYLGASSTAAWQFAQALSLSERNGWARFVSMQNHYNLIYREEEREMVPLCQAEGIAVIPWSPLARGLLAGTRKTPDDKTATVRAVSDEFARKLYDHPADIEVMQACRAVADRLGAEPAQVAIAWLLAKPAVTAPIIGATKIEHLEAALAAADLKLGNEEIQQLEMPYQPHAVRGFD
jgi:aryl-alcohol dehydrogenase-like predicted oxidoreductase